MCKKHSTSLFISCLLLAACGGSDQQPASHPTTGTALQILTGIGLQPLQNSQSPGNDPVDNSQSGNTSNLDQRLAVLVQQHGLTGNPATGLNLPSVNDPITQLGMKLFYSKSLGGEKDSACVTCHHPSLGGADQLSLGIGVEAVEPDLLGPGRRHISGKFTVPRNAPTTFNSALYRKSLFWDSRVSQLDGGIRTPESSWAVPDQTAGDSLLEAQARFPITSAEEMRTHRFEADGTNSHVREHLAARIGGYDGGYNAQAELATNNWLPEFQRAFGSSQTAENLISYDNIAVALASYEASQLFIDNPWNRYVAGDQGAITVQAKQGALLFFTDKNNGGGHCSSCHSGDLFSDEQNHLVAFPQTGPGKGDGVSGDDDFGLERETGNRGDRYRFRTPSLLNISMTAPYGHTGAYQTLEQVISHYSEIEDVLTFFDDSNWCKTIVTDSSAPCSSRFANARTNTSNALEEIGNQTIGEENIENINLNADQIAQIAAFLETLTDPCTRSRECLAPWIADPAADPDGHQLNGTDQFGNRL